MDTYIIEITKTLSRLVTVEANSIDEARELVEDSYYNGDIILTADDFISWDIAPYE